MWFIRSHQHNIYIFTCMHLTDAFNQSDLCMLFLLLVYMLCSKLFITLVNVIKGGCENKSAVYPFDISLNINKNESGGKSHI